MTIPPRQDERAYTSRGNGHPEPPEMVQECPPGSRQGGKSRNPGNIPHRRQAGKPLLPIIVSFVPGQGHPMVGRFFGPGFSAKTTDREPSSLACSRISFHHPCSIFPAESAKCTGTGISVSAGLRTSQLPNRSACRPIFSMFNMPQPPFPSPRAIRIRFESWPFPDGSRSTLQDLLSIRDWIPGRIPFR